MTAARLVFRLIALVFMAAWLGYTAMRHGGLATIVAPGVLLAVAADDIRRFRTSPVWRSTE